MKAILNENLQQYRARIDEIIKNLHQLTTTIRNEELAQTVSDLRNRIKEPFMFVIVGEVKAGKSSFINALLDTGREITKVAPQPMTDTVQQIIYGEKESITVINPFLKQITQPVEILKEIAIVDTPGTNTIAEQHQEITERFVPASDLIVFVFEAKNPYRQSAWDFFDYIHADWRKKIIFVLQQKDLLDEADLQVNLQGVRDHAIKKGIEKPLIFATSAKLEQEGEKMGSGFGQVRLYIKDNITGGKAPVLKLQNNLDTSLNISERIASGVADRRRQYEADVNFRMDIKETLDNQSIKSAKQVDMLVENMIATYDKITSQKEQELRSGLSFFSLVKRSFSSMFSKKESAKDWLENLANNLGTDLNTAMQAKLSGSINDLADSIQQMAKIIDLKIQNSTTILKNDHAIFSDIAERRANVMKELNDTFHEFLSKSENFRDEKLFPDKQTISPNFAVGSGVAFIAAVVTAVTQNAVLDITGGVLTAVGLLFAGFSTSIKKRKIINGYTTEVDQGRIHLERELNTKLKGYIEHIKSKIDDNFDNFDVLLEKETNQLDQFEGQLSSIKQDLNSMQAELKS